MTTTQKDHSTYKGDKDIQSQNNFKRNLNGNSSTNGLGSDAHKANGASSSYADDDDDNDEYGYEFQITDDQRKAAGELQNLKLDLGFAGKFVSLFITGCKMRKL